MTRDRGKVDQSAGGRQSHRVRGTGGARGRRTEDRRRPGVHPCLSTTSWLPTTEPLPPRISAFPTFQIPPTRADSQVGTTYSVHLRKMSGVPPFPLFSHGRLRAKGTTADFRRASEIRRPERWHVGGQRVSRCRPWGSITPSSRAGLCFAARTSRRSHFEGLAFAQERRVPEGPARIP